MKRRRLVPLEFLAVLAGIFWGVAAWASNFNKLSGATFPASGEGVPMDLANPLTLNFQPSPGAAAYDIYTGTISNSVFLATRNTAGIYLGRTDGLTFSAGALQPHTTYYWRVDSVALGGAITVGKIRSFTTGAAMFDEAADTWAATDSLGRSLPGLAECGSPREDRPMGIFYFLWHGSYSYGLGTNWDCSKYLSTHPFRNPHNPWADNSVFDLVSSGRCFYWGEPAAGYYRPTDPWALRRHIALLTHAGVDVLILDYSNAVTYDTELTALCDMIRQMRMEGFPTRLKIVFLTHAISGHTATTVYNNFYSQNKYPDLWFYWQGKPLMLGYVHGVDATDTPPANVQSFFTWRTSWAYVATNALRDEWQWIDCPTPQNWGWNGRADLPEELPVSCGGWANGNLGRSQNNNTQPRYDGFHLPLGRTSHLGLFFAEQIHYGLKYDPQFLFVTGWNEWIAGAFKAPRAGFTSVLADPTPLNGYYFVDEYNQEYSRDLEPMKGGHSDNYYYQLVSLCRQRKGVRPITPASTPQTINMLGDFSDWSSVAPAYYDPLNDTAWRNFPSSVSQTGIYTNSTGRNDFTVLKVARDATYLYFFAQCSSNITSYTSTNWMVLFLDTDQNHATGWEGYDFAINLGPRIAGATSLSQNTSLSNAWNWTTVRSDLSYQAAGNKFMVRIPRADLGLGGDPVSFDFHWADNFQTNDIADFGVNGDSAPDRRFNYRFATGTNSETVLLADDFERGRQGIWAETWNTGSQWSLTTAYPYSSNTCAVANFGSGQSNLIARRSTAGIGSFRLNFHFKLHNVRDAQNLQIQYLATNGWAPIRKLSRDEYYPMAQTWSYDEQQDVWLNFTDVRANTGTDARFFHTNFAIRIDARALTAVGQKVWVDDVRLTANPAAR